MLLKTQIHLRLFILFLLWLSCENNPPTSSGKISDDPSSIRSGQRAFAQDCSPCHNFNQDAIGPNLAGITDEVPLDWLRSFISDPKTMIDQGDERASLLFAEYHVYMPGFSFYSDQKIDNVIAYLSTQKGKNQQEEKFHGKDPIINPIETPIPGSEVVVELEPFVTIPASSTSMPATRIVKMEHIPRADRIFVADLRGKFFEILNRQPIEVLDFNRTHSNFINKPGLATGFGSFAFHPEFLDNGLLYTTHTEVPDGTADFRYDDSIKVALQWVLTEWKYENPAASRFVGSRQEVMRIDMVSGIHGVQEIAFNPHATKGSSDYGCLYLGVGDGGSAGLGYYHLPADPRFALGSIFRIDPRGSNSTNGKYGVPSDNPFVDHHDTLPEIFAYGFRNAHRLSWDASGRLLATGIGHHRLEEVNEILPGRNYGWPFREGTFAINPKGNLSNVYPLPKEEEQEYSYPVVQFDHEEGNAISGGYEYQGTAIPDLVGKYIFGCIVRGRLFFADIQEMEFGKPPAKVSEWRVSVDGEIKDLVSLCGSSRVDLRFAKDSSEEMYIMTKADGQIYRMAGVLGE